MVVGHTAIFNYVTFYSGKLCVGICCYYFLTVIKPNDEIRNKNKKIIRLIDNGWGGLISALMHMLNVQFQGKVAFY